MAYEYTNTKNPRGKWKTLNLRSEGNPAYSLPYISLKLFGFHRCIHNNVHICGWCGCDICMKGLHGNRILCNRCKTRWDTGNKDYDVVMKWLNQVHKGKLPDHLKWYLNIAKNL